MIEEPLEQLGLPDDAHEWLLSMWRVTQFLDDVADKDDINEDEFNNALWDIMLRMPSNSFYRANVDALAPVIALQTLKWQAANVVEKSGSADERSYMWRAGYYDLVLMVCLLCFGSAMKVQKAVDALMIYGESYADYTKEFENA